MIFYFSGCGNSRYVAHELGRLTSDKVINIAECGRSQYIELSEDEPLGIVCPVYSWAVPHVVVDFITSLQFSSTPAYCYLACTCGDSVGRTPEHFARCLRRAGLRLDATFGFVMPETYVNLPGFNTDTVENVERKLVAVKERLPHVARRIVRHERTTDVVRGRMAWFNTYVVNRLFYRWIITDRRFRSTEACVSCGLCAEVCPLYNITMEDNRPSWHGNCTNCMACYHHCPHNAVQFGRATRGKGQYLFDHSFLDTHQ